MDRGVNGWTDGWILYCPSGENLHSVCTWKLWRTVILDYREHRTVNTTNRGVMPNSDARRECATKLVWLRYGEDLWMRKCKKKKGKNEAMLIHSIQGLVPSRKVWSHRMERSLRSFFSQFFSAYDQFFCLYNASITVNSRYLLHMISGLHNFNLNFNLKRSLWLLIWRTNMT